MKKSVVVLLCLFTFFALAYGGETPNPALVYTDADNYSPSAMETAISNLNWSALIINNDTDSFLDYLSGNTWDIIVVECFNGASMSELVQGLDCYINGDYGSANHGLKLVLFTSGMDNCDDAALWSDLGMTFESDISGSYNAYVWYDEDGIFSEPNGLTGPFSVDYASAEDKGDKHSASTGKNYTGSCEIAGVTENATDGEGVICYQPQIYRFEDPITYWWGPHLIATINTDCITDQALASGLWENALYNTWYSEYAVSIESASLGQIKALLR